MGTRNVVQKRLMKFVKKYYNHLSLEDKKEFKEFFIRNEKKENGLEKSLVSSVFLMIFIAGLFFSVPKITGGVIGVSKFGSSIIGSILMIIGIVGSFFYMFFNK
ncbi:MAG: hypothetical protein WC812_00070 [Candidatus Pacearchaeota archaeon]|jgi:hypothetical protein